ncbi:MAG: ABC transporter permease [Chloroflexaceae bacterium]|jgi:peptide/nickel transport system permease protein|nr:ABC transporter permease [Chloroflexaceae bacterium]
MDVARNLPNGMQPALPADVAEELAALEREDASGRAVATASQWKLMWWRFRKHTLAKVSLAVLGFLFLVAIFADAIAPYDPTVTQSNRTYAPPQPIYIIENGRLTWPFALGLKSTIDAESLRRMYVLDHEQRIDMGLFVQGEPYRLLGLFETNTRLFGASNGAQQVSVLGSDRLGRDLFSRMVHATRISLSIGLAAVFVSLLLGVTLGGISGYVGGRVDMVIQRVVEFIDAIPSLPLWMGLSAAIPLTWPPLWVYFAITLVLSLLGWTGMARVVRGRFLAMREEDFVMAARVSGSGERRIIFRHMLPSFVSHIIASLTLTIPGRILGETSLSFLGLGLKEPIISYGVLLQDAQNIRAVATAPWLIVPALVVVVIVIAYNFLGDGLRDAADPYA